MVYLKLLRVKHYMKNLLIFFPLIFSLNLFQSSLWGYSVIGFVFFSLLTSVVYMINDIKDKEDDSKHPTKKNRPIASGKVSIQTARFISLFLFLISMASLFALFSLQGNIGIVLFPTLYLINNFIYTYKIKQIPILDVLSIAVGFLFRVLFGSALIDVYVSPFLYLTILTLAFYMGYGKRRGEYHLPHKRKVLNHYPLAFLEKSMTMCVTLAIVFYVMWGLRLSDDYWVLMITTPLILLILMRYNFVIEGDSDGDPVEVMVKDKFLFTSIIFYGVSLIILLYR